MAAFGDLTPDQQKIITDFSMLMRTYVSEMARVLNRLNALNDDFISVVGPVLNLITAPDNGTPIHDNTGLAGTVPLTAYQIGLIISHVQALLVTNTDVNRQVWVAACGPQNLAG